MELTGTIKVLGETKEFGSNGFRKREMVVTTEEQYPQHILIEFVQDKCSVLDNYAEGQQVKIGINLRGREWVNPQGEAKYFNTIQGWKIEATASQSGLDSPESVEPTKDLNDNQIQEDDGLPF